MRILLNHDSWELEEMRDLEWVMLLQLPQAADHRNSEKGRKRLFPEPTPENDEKSQELTADWKEFVQPELESQFTRDLELVTKDLGNVEEEEDDEGNVEHFLSVPLKHAETWYSVLNQARLIINEEHDVSTTERKLYMGEQTPSELGEKRWLTMIQYRIYGALQEFILTNIMEPGLEEE